MPQIKALLFLTLHSWWNSFRRSMLTPRRAIGLILFLLATVGVWSTRAMQVMVARESTDSFSLIKLNLHLPEGFWNIAFMVEFAILGFFALLLPASWLVLPITFKKPDVDILFATPVSPRLLLLAAMFRGQLKMTLYAIITLVIRAKSLTGFGGKVNASSAEVIHDFSTALFYFLLAFMLLNLVRASWAFGMGIFLNRDEERSRRLLKRFRIFALLCGLVAVPGPMSIGLLKPSKAQLLGFFESEIPRVGLFPASLGGWVANGNLNGFPFLFVIGVVSLLAISAIGIAVSLRQTEWLYDIGARMSALSTATRMDDSSLTLSETAAVQGNRAAKRSKLRRFVGRQKAFGLWAFLWRECVQQPWGVLIGYSLLLIGAIVLPIISANVSRGALVGPLIQVVIWPILFGTRFGPAAGLLSKIDLVKALPFSSTKLLFAAISIRLAPTVAALLIADIVNIVVGSYAISIGVGAFFALPFLLAANSAATAIATMIVPDFHDKTQLGLSALVNLVTKIAVNLPWALVLGVAMIWLPFWAAALLTIIPNFFVAWLCLYQAGKLYENYNPSE